MVKKKSQKNSEKKKFTFFKKAKNKTTEILDMVAHQLPAITDAAVIAGNINFGVNIKNWLVAQLGPIFLVCAIVSVFVFSPDVFKDLGTKLYNLVFK